MDFWNVVLSSLVDRYKQSGKSTVPLFRVDESESEGSRLL
jgi:hypothetical protein